MEKLTRAQKSVLRLIFDDKQDEEKALEQANITIRVYELWFRQPLWSREYSNRLQRCQRRADIMLSTFKEFAAAKLITLTDCEKETVARQACIDIINKESKEAEVVEEKPVRKMKPETQEAILNIMAEEGNNGEKHKDNS